MMSPNSDRAGTVLDSGPRGARGRLLIQAQKRKLRDSPRLDGDDRQQAPRPSSDDDLLQPDVNELMQRPRYYRGTQMPVAGWFHPCKVCRCWTATMLDGNSGRVVPVCRRCVQLSRDKVDALLTPQAVWQSADPAKQQLQLQQRQQQNEQQAAPQPDQQQAPPPQQQQQQGGSGLLLSPDGGQPTATTAQAFSGPHAPSLLQQAAPAFGALPAGQHPKEASRGEPAGGPQPALGATATPNYAGAVAAALLATGADITPAWACGSSCGTCGGAAATGACSNNSCASTDEFWERAGWLGGGGAPSGGQPRHKQRRYSDAGLSDSSHFLPLAAAGVPVAAAVAAAAARPAWPSPLQQAAGMPFGGDAPCEVRGVVVAGRRARSCLADVRHLLRPDGFLRTQQQQQVQALQQVAPVQLPPVPVALPLQHQPPLPFFPDCGALLSHAFGPMVGPVPTAVMAPMPGVLMQITSIPTSLPGMVPLHALGGCSWSPCPPGAAAAAAALAAVAAAAQTRALWGVPGAAAGGTFVGAPQSVGVAAISSERGCRPVG